jgi:hypothetical protein
MLKERYMENRIHGCGPRKTLSAMALAALVAMAGMGEANALNVLTFDSGDAERNSSVGAFGFSMTQVGSNHVAGLDFTLYDVIYVSQSYEEFLTSSLSASLGARAADLATYVAGGGGLVFGSPAIGGGLGGITAPVPGPITQNVDLSTLGLAPLPSLPGLNVEAENALGAPTLVSGEFGEGRFVGWTPDPMLGNQPITQDGLTLVENSIQWAAGEMPAVPEPGTFALMGLGLAGILLVRRRAQVR